MEIITVDATIKATVANVWKLYTAPEDIKQWNNASDDWHTPEAESDLRVGGRFRSRMEAKDGSAGFDFMGTFKKVTPNEELAYIMDDGRKVNITFNDEGEQTKVTVAFEPETENSPELQRSGWKAILDNFKKYAEGSMEQIT
jgi:uncharacterized protein YndB with AHSA1/START domain